MWEWLKTISLLKSEYTKDITNPKKLTVTKKNCKKVSEIILLSRWFWLSKFLIEKKIIKKEQASAKFKE